MPERHLVYGLGTIKYDGQAIQVFYTLEHRVAQSVNDKIQWTSPQHVTRMHVEILKWQIICVGS